MVVFKKISLLIVIYFLSFIFIREIISNHRQWVPNRLFLNHNQYNKVNLCDFLKHIKTKFESNYQIHINLQFKVNCNKFKLKFNKVYLKVILDNLLKNAHQHSQEIYIVLERFFNDEYTIHTTPAFKLSVKNKKSEYKGSKKSNMVGLELIDTMCSRMNIDWNFFEKDNEFEFVLFLKDMF